MLQNLCHSVNWTLHGGTDLSVASFFFAHMFSSRCHIEGLPVVQGQLTDDFPVVPPLPATCSPDCRKQFNSTYTRAALRSAYRLQLSWEIVAYPNSNICPQMEVAKSY